MGQISVCRESEMMLLEMMLLVCQMREDLFNLLLFRPKVLTE